MSHDNTILGMQAHIEDLKQRVLEERARAILWEQRALFPDGDRTPWEQLPPSDVRGLLRQAAAELGGEFLLMMPATREAT